MSSPSGTARGKKVGNTHTCIPSEHGAAKQSTPEQPGEGRSATHTHAHTHTMQPNNPLRNSPGKEGRQHKHKHAHTHTHTHTESQRLMHSERGQMLEEERNVCPGPVLRRSLHLWRNGYCVRLPRMVHIDFLHM